MSETQKDAPPIDTKDEYELSRLSPAFSIDQSAGATSNVSADDFQPEYFLTRFVFPLHSPKFTAGLPGSFAIISAYATTGESWSEEKNNEADARLFHALITMGLTPVRVLAYSPETAHEEPSWCVETSWENACDIGVLFKQDAIYYVIGAELFVTFCDDRRTLVLVDQFNNRLDR